MPCLAGSTPTIPASLLAGFALLQILVAAKLFTVGHNADQVLSHWECVSVFVLGFVPRCAPWRLSCTTTEVFPSPFNLPLQMMLSLWGILTFSEHAAGC